MQPQQTAINSCPDHKQNWLDQSAMQLLIVKKSVFIQINTLFNNIGCCGEIQYKGILVHDATAYQGITHSLVKNGGFGLTLTNPLYKLYTVMLVQINPWLFILDQGQKSHLQLFHVAESQQIVFRMSSLYSSTGRRRSNTLSVCIPNAWHCASQMPNTSLQKKRVPGALLCGRALADQVCMQRDKSALS